MNTLRSFLYLARPFWANPRRWLDWLLLITVIGMALSIIWVGVWINLWNKAFYDALAAFDGAAMPRLVLMFLGYIALTVFFIVTGNWLRKVLIFRWRKEMSERFQNQWLQGHRHQLLRLLGEPDNPDQRIAEDIRLLTESSVDLLKYFLMNLAKLAAFVVILWNIGDGMPLIIGDVSVTIPGYLVWVALIFSVVCTILTHLIGRRLKHLNIERQHVEADYRATLLRVRDHSAEISLLQGEPAEESRMLRRFDRIGRNWFSLIACELRVETFSATYLRVAMFIPIVATLPMYLSRAITFGDMMQARNAFSNVQDGFGWFMDYYKRLMEWAAIVARLAELSRAMSGVASPASVRASDAACGGPRIACRELTLSDREGRVLLRDVSFDCQAPGWMLLDGPSGIGKTTLLRTFAGLWPYYTGTAHVEGRVMFLPQKDYLPQDSLRRVLSYPDQVPFPDDQLVASLAAVGMGRLSDQLDRNQDWSAILSGGERQRLSLARVLLRRPQILCLDEATNQMDAASSVALITEIRCALPQLICLGTSHQPEIKALFDRRIALDGTTCSPETGQ